MTFLEVTFLGGGDFELLDGGGGVDVVHTWVQTSVRVTQLAL